MNQNQQQQQQTIVQQHKENFETLRRAFKNDDVCLLDCTDKDTGAHVAVICTIRQVGEEVEFTPFARFFNGNPFDMLIPPMDEVENKPEDGTTH